MATPLILAPLDGDLAYEDGASGGTATGTGALRWRDGHTGGVQSAFVEEGTTNDATDGSFEGGTGGVGGYLSTVTQSADVALHGANSLKVVTTASHRGGQTYPGTPAAQGDTITVSAPAYTAGSGNGVRVFGYERTGTSFVANLSTTTFPLTAGEWTENIVKTYTITGAATNNFDLRLYSDNSSGQTWYHDKLQIEKKDHATSFAAGDMGAGYSWTGTAYASSSVRADTTISIPTSAPGSVAVRYSEDGVTWDFAYMETLGTLGTYGSITHDGSNLVIASSRALYVGPVFAFADTLTAPEQATLETESDWTFGMLSGPVAVTTVHPQIIGLGSVAV